ncbi:MAG: DUF2491 family protein [Acidobacteriota bacterium]
MFFGKRAASDHHPDYPEFPLDLRIGAILAVDAAELLRFAGLDHSFTPPQGELLVEALSRTPLFGLSLVRAYARQGRDAFLFQFNLDAAGALNDISLFRLLEEIRPATAEDWSLWLDPGGLIGGNDLNAPNGQRYLRQWGDGAYAAPVAMDEAIFADPKAPPRRVAHQMQLYGRELGEEHENLLLSADTEPDAALVRAWVGLDLTSYGVKIY